MASETRHVRGCRRILLSVIAFHCPRPSYRAAGQVMKQIYSVKDNYVKITAYMVRYVDVFNVKSNKADMLVFYYDEAIIFLANAIC